MTFPRSLLLIALCCATCAWFLGPLARFLVVLPLLLLGPGYLVERMLPEATRPSSLFSRLAIWLGLSLSLVVLLYEWTTPLGVVLTASLLRLIALGCALGVIWRIWCLPVMKGPMLAHTHRMVNWPALALFAIFVLTVGMRFVQIQELVLPAWVDSVHHALLIRVAAEHGQVPYSLRPYLPVDNLPYHWGYHVFTAALIQITGMALPQAMLWEGQVLNALHVLTVGALAIYLWRRPVAGVVAGLVVGLLSIMPAYYVSWGRYTQLMGLLLLPPLVISWYAGLRAPSWRWAICTALLLAGLSAIHFRVLIFALGLMGAIGIMWALDRRSSSLRSQLWFVALSGGVALVLTAPWLWSLLSRMFLPIVENPQRLAGNESYNMLNENLLWAGQGRLLIAGALVSALWGILHRSRVTIEQVVWIALLFVLANPWLIGYLLPVIGVALMSWGSGRRQIVVVLGGAVLLLLNPALISFPYLWLITSDVIVISLFIPIAILIGGATCRILDWVAHLKLPSVRLIARIAGTGALCLLALGGAWNSRSVVNPNTILATQGDVEAIAWVAEHIPADARFLINASPWLNVYRGSDGGWWLLPLAGRWTSMPPALYTYGPSDYVDNVRALNAQIVGFHQGQEQQLYDLIDRERITYIYLGAKKGPLLPTMFMGSDAFKKVYERDGVTILAVQRQS